ncbi:hypothetical protein HPP92_027122 [Vanilla planifolia]|uniref:Pentatricopeptide repeat-containing protein n=1 Tax=Vanilla planifolia TaxID=51239 RepID=A0A835P9U5_VANPL|nr:hypothetical protein HPP92_027122 [Vanilla planifolia]
MLPLPIRDDAYRWNAALRGLLDSNKPWEAILGFAFMRSRGVGVDSYAVLFLTKALSLLRPLISPVGRIHSLVIKVGFQSSVIIQTSLLKTYSMFGDLQAACKVFDDTPHKDFVQWNALISSYQQAGQPQEAVRVACSMVKENFRPNQVTMVIVLTSCSQRRDFANGKSVHGYALKNLLGLDAFVHNALIHMYCRCGCLASARKLFEMMNCRNEVTWASMIGGYTDNNCPHEALFLFKKMECENVMPDEVTVLSVISMCTKLESLELAEQIAGYAKKNGYQETVCIANALIDMYSKCGDINKSCKIFNQMTNKNVLSWTAMIQGLALHGKGMAALTRFIQMQREGFKPDEILFLSIMNACNYAGMVPEGGQCLKSMVGEFQLMPWIEHYGIMVDLLCRTGHLQQAFDFVLGMPMKPDGAIWRTLIRACEEQENIGLARQLMELLIKIEPENSENYVMKSNLHAAIGEWDDVKHVRLDMGIREIIKKHPGWSRIER